jgi:hypothetical protein
VSGFSGKTWATMAGCVFAASFTAAVFALDHAGLFENDRMAEVILVLLFVGPLRIAYGAISLAGYHIATSDGMGHGSEYFAIATWAMYLAAYGLAFRWTYSSVAWGFRRLSSPAWRMAAGEGEADLSIEPATRGARWFDAKAWVTVVGCAAGVALFCIGVLFRLTLMIAPVEPDPISCPFNIIYEATTKLLGKLGLPGYMELVWMYAGIAAAAIILTLGCGFAFRWAYATCAWLRRKLFVA